MLDTRKYSIIKGITYGNRQWSIPLKKMLNVFLLMCVVLSFGCAAQVEEVILPVEPTIQPTIEPLKVDGLAVVIGPEDIGTDWGELETDDSKYNGYMYEYEGEVTDNWIPGVPTYESWFTPAPKITIGNAYPYGWSVMESTAEYNGFSLEGYVDGVALMSPADQGLPVWLKRPGYDWEGPFLVVDCARRTDFYNVSVHNQEVVEVGFETAVRWGMATEREKVDGKWMNYWPMKKVENVIVSKIQPNNLDSDYEIVNYKDWFLDMVRFDFFKSDAEATAYYSSVPRMLSKPSEKLNGMPYWRIPPSDEYVQFQKEPVEIFGTSADMVGLVEEIAMAESHEMIVETPTSVIKEFEVDAGEFWIEISISQQILYAYRGDMRVNQFVISSGVARTPTPLGSYKIYSMYPEYTMQGQTESIPAVPSAMFFHGGYALHGTFWHNEFGKPMSRGCINLTVEDAEWIYNRVTNGTHVYVHI